MRGDGLFSYEGKLDCTEFVNMRELGHFVLNPTSPFLRSSFLHNSVIQLAQPCHPVDKLKYYRDPLLH